MFFAVLAAFLDVTVVEVQAILVEVFPGITKIFSTLKSNDLKDV